MMYVLQTDGKVQVEYEYFPTLHAAYARLIALQCFNTHRYWAIYRLKLIDKVDS